MMLEGATDFDELCHIGFDVRHDRIVTIEFGEQVVVLVYLRGDKISLMCP